MRVCLLPFLFLACGSPPPHEAPPGDWVNVAPAIVREVHPCGDAMVLRIEEAVWDFFVVTPSLEVVPGDHVLLGRGAAVANHECGGTVFPEVLRIDQVVKASEEDERAAIIIRPPEGGMAVADVYAQRTALVGQTVSVAGRVVKASKGIYGTNWYHLRDGTGEEGTNDLTVTSSNADLVIGDVVEASGPLTIDKDLGYGYFYAAIIEGATVTRR